MARCKRAFILTVLILAPIMLLSSRAGAGAVGDKSQRGENIFRAKCSVCHGVDGGGQTENGKKLKVPDLRSDKVQNLSDEEMLDSVMNGKGYMPPMGKKYSADQLRQVIVYVRALGRKN
jgi:mono/diheme cytochrome c family protein